MQLAIIFLPVDTVLFLPLGAELADAAEQIRGIAFDLAHGLFELEHLVAFVLRLLGMLERTLEAKELIAAEAGGLDTSLTLTARPVATTHT